jgi:hypothetical protein
MTITQSTCGAGEITFSKPAGFFSSSSEIARVRAEDGKRYTLTSDASGAITVDVAAHAKPR